MMCDWKSLMTLMPDWLKYELNNVKPTDLLDIRLRLGYEAQLITTKGFVCLHRLVSSSDIQFVINVASRYSPWASSTVSNGYITAKGGHRIGISGFCVLNENGVKGISSPTSLCIRVAKFLPGISRSLSLMSGSVLIIGQPGSGKTTLLRDLIVQKSNHNNGSICVIDEKEEIFPFYHNRPAFMTGPRTDVIAGCKKSDGIIMAIRNMGPQTIAVDEITAAEDCRAMIQAGWCGIDLVATAHAGSLMDLHNRPIYRPLLECGLFQTVVVMHMDKTWALERMY